MADQGDVGSLAGALVVDLVEAAIRTEGKGQLNISKLLRASAQAVARSAAAEQGFPDDSKRLAEDLSALAERLRSFGMDASTSDRIALGAELIAAGEQSFLDQFPDPYVCRRCGLLVESAPSSGCGECGAHELTFQRFEPVYWMTLYQPHEVVERLTATPDLFRSAIDRLPPDRLDWTPPGTAWAAVDVLRHIRDAQSVLAQRIELILDETDPSLEFQAVFDWTNDGLDEGGSADAMMESYVESRGGSVSRLRAIASEDWRRTGRHEEFGRVMLIEQASYFAAHELTHIRQLEQLRRAAESPE